MQYDNMKRLAYACVFISVIAIPIIGIMAFLVGAGARSNSILYIVASTSLLSLTGVISGIKYIRKPTQTKAITMIVCSIYSLTFVGLVIAWLSRAVTQCSNDSQHCPPKLRNIFSILYEETNVLSPIYPNSTIEVWWSHQELNLELRFRKAPLYPFNYGSHHQFLAKLFLLFLV